MIGILTRVFCISDPNLVILSWTADLADKQVIDTHTQRHTDKHTQVITIPEGQNWPRVKMDMGGCMGSIHPSTHIHLYWEYDYLYMLILMLDHLSFNGPWNINNMNGTRKGKTDQQGETSASGDLSRFYSSFLCYRYIKSLVMAQATSNFIVGLKWSQLQIRSCRIMFVIETMAVMPSRVSISLSFCCYTLNQNKQSWGHVGSFFQ